MKNLILVLFLFVSISVFSQKIDKIVYIENQEVVDIDDNPQSVLKQDGPVFEVFTKGELIFSFICTDYIESGDLIHCKGYFFYPGGIKFVSYLTISFEKLGYVIYGFSLNSRNDRVIVYVKN